MRNIDTLNALTNPIGHGEQVTIAGAVYTVGQDMRGFWFLHTPERPHACSAGSQVDFIARIVAYSDQLNAEFPNAGRPIVA